MRDLCMRQGSLCQEPTSTVAMGETGRILEGVIACRDVRTDTDIRTRASVVATPLLFLLVARDSAAGRQLRGRGGRARSRAVEAQP